MRSVLAASALPTEGLVRYRHWDNAVDADVDFEAKRLADLSPPLAIAKSLGTVIAARAFCTHRFRPRSAILIGTPYGAGEPADLACLRQLAEGVETLFIQQTEDPGGAASRLAASLRLSQSEVTTVPGNDHVYADVQALAAVIREWQRKAR
ncbi:MAG: hypothetical protein ACK5TK_06745 [Betaproteobacteria bacterium]